MLLSLALTAGTAAAAPPSGGGGTTTTAPKLTAVAALSRHRLLATYDKALTSTALQASSYAFATASGVLLPVRAVAQGPTPNQALISTDVQEAVPYTVKKPKTPRPVTFTGSLDGEPTLQAASALSTTQVSLTFSEPLGEGSELPASYQITVPGTTRTLAVTAVSKFLGATQLLLTTAPQDTSTFAVKVGDIKGLSGEYIDPTANTARFTGSTAPDRGLLLSAVPQGDTGVLLTFDRAVTAASASDVRSYVTTPNLFVGSATQSADKTQVVLSTGVHYQVQYTVVANVVDTEGRPLLNPLMNSASFMGARTFSADRPKVTSAASTGNTSVVVQFSKPMADNTPDPSRFFIYQTNVNPEVGTVGIKSAEWAGNDRLSVRLTTYSQAEVTYTVTAHNVTDMLGNPLADRTNVAGVLVDPTSFTFPGTPPTFAPCTKVVSQTARKVTMSANARATATGVTLSVGSRSVANLTTTNGSPDVTSAVDAFTSQDVGKDISGAGIPGCIDERVDTDGDGVYDHEETRGWEVTIKLATAQTVTVTNSDGSTTTTTTMTSTRQVTSSPESRDTDNDGLTDYEEKALNLDARDNDTDDDQISDWGEFNRIFSDPTIQDTDGDTLFDGLEVVFFRTSAILADTDGDQLLDGIEITLGNRNARVSDLAKPSLEIGEMRLDLDVRFVDELGGVETEVDSFTETATLVQSERQEFSFSSSGTVEAGLKASQKVALEAQIGSAESYLKANWEATQEQSYSASFTTGFTDTSSVETTEAYERSLTTTKAREEHANQTRQINAARMQANVMLASAGDIAFRIKNIQLTAHMQDPQNPDRLTPIATLDPDNAPADGYALGPLTPPKGPVIFSSDTVFPKMVEDLMRNPRGVVFRFSNYDIVDEKDRNFAFTSQDVNDRTARIAIDHGGFDRDGDGQGDDSEILRVATGTGRRIEDIDKDGTIDGDDLPIVFDASGKPVGISLREALQAAGLTEYKEAETPTSALNQASIDSSYSVVTVPGRGERIHRIRRTQRSTSKEWQIITPTGIDTSRGLDDIIMTSGQSYTLSFVQDLDRDNLTALVERLNGCSDLVKDSDADGLDDRFETAVGWTIDTDLGRGTVRSRCVNKDTDRDGLGDAVEAPRLIERDAAGLVRFDPGHEPKRYTGNEVFDRVLSDAAMLALPARTGDMARRVDGDAGPRLFVLRDGAPTQLASWVRLFDGITSEAEMVALPATPGDLARRIDNAENPHPLYELTTNPVTGLTSWVRLDDPVFTQSGYTFPVATAGARLSLPARQGDLAEVAGAGSPPPTFLLVGTSAADPAAWVELSPDLTSPDEVRRLVLPQLIDPITNPSRKDTDDDGLDDRYEGIPHTVALYPATEGSTAPLVTSPELFDTDGDTASDGLEERVGGDPTVRDLENFTDADGDGLVNLEETQGWKVQIEKVSTLPLLGSGLCDSVCAPGQQDSERNVVSDPFDPDSDDDGLTDAEERDAARPEGVTYRGTDPKSRDTDGDGLTDFVEVRGYSHAGFGILSTDPGDADSDNDKRTDGAEKNTAIVIRPVDADPYAVLSNPTKPDSDLDRLVDGDEAAKGTDPMKANTDGDNRNDYVEVGIGRNPLIPDMKVTMQFDRLVITDDAEGDNGDFTFEFWGSHKKSDGREYSALAAHSSYQTVSGAEPLVIPECGENPCRPDIEPHQNFPSFGAEDKVIQIAAGKTLPLNRTVVLGSVATSENALEQISVIGNLIEWDGATHTKESIRFNFPDPYLELITDGTGTVLGKDLKVGTNSMAIRRTGTDSEGHKLDFTLLVSYTAE